MRSALFLAWFFLLTLVMGIVFLPLLGAILAAIISLAGAGARFPGKGPPPGVEDTLTEKGPHHHAEPIDEPAGVIHATLPAIGYLLGSSINDRIR